MPCCTGAGKASLRTSLASRSALCSTGLGTARPVMSSCPVRPWPLWWTCSGMPLSRSCLPLPPPPIRRPARSGNTLAQHCGRRSLLPRSTVALVCSYPLQEELLRHELTVVAYPGLRYPAAENTGSPLEALPSRHFFLPTSCPGFAFHPISMQVWAKLPACASCCPPLRRHRGVACSPDAP